MGDTTQGSTNNQKEAKKVAILKLEAFLDKATKAAQRQLAVFMLDPACLFLLQSVKSDDVKDAIPATTARFNPYQRSDSKQWHVWSNAKSISVQLRSGIQENDRSDQDRFEVGLALYRKGLLGTVASSIGQPNANLDDCSLFVRCDRDAALPDKHGAWLGTTQSIVSGQPKNVSQVTPAEFMRIGRTGGMPTAHPFLAFFKYEKGMSGDTDIVSACRGAESVAGCTFTHCHLFFIPDSEVRSISGALTDESCQSPIAHFATPRIWSTSQVTKLIAKTGHGEAMDVSASYRMTHDEYLFTGPVDNIPNLLVVSVALTHTLVDILKKGCSIAELRLVASASLGRSGPCGPVVPKWSGRTAGAEPHNSS